MYNEKLDCETMDLTDELRDQGNFVRLPHNLLRLNKISMQARLVWAALYSYGWKNNPIFPGMDTVADDMGCSKKTLLKYRKELEEVGLLRVKRQGLNKPNKYTLGLPVTPKDTSEIPETNTLTDQETNTTTHLKANTSSQEVEKINKTKIKKKSVCTHSSIMAKINKSKPTPEEIKNADTIIDYIKEVSSNNGTQLKFSKTKSSRGDIIEGLRTYSMEDLKLVVELKVEEWIGGAKTLVWINPNTLFREAKIDNNVTTARGWAKNGKKSVGCKKSYKGVLSGDDYGSVVR